MAALPALGLILAGAIGALRVGFVPLADDAVVAVRSRDVFSSMSPLLGMPSSANRVAGLDVDHPGPLLFWIYAPGVRAFGSAVGLILGAAAIGCGSVLASGWVAYRRRGLSSGLLGVALVTTAIWTIGGPSATFRPVNAVMLAVPFALHLLLCWGIAERDIDLLPGAAFTGSFLVQANLVLLAPVALATATALLIGLRSPGDRPALHPVGRSRVAVATAAVVIVALGLSTGGLPGGLVALAALAVAATIAFGVGGRGLTRSTPGPWLRATWILGAVWALPIHEALSRDGGNVAAMVDYARGSVAVEGVSGAFAATQAALHWPNQVIDEAGYRLGASLSVVLVLVGLAFVARRQVGAVAVAVAAVAGAALTGAHVPSDEGFVFAQLFWLPVIAAFVWLVVADALLHRLDHPRWFGPAVTVALIVVLASHVALRTDDFGPQAREHWAYEVTEQLGDRTIASIDDDTDLVVHAGGSFSRRVARGVIDQLDERGHDLRVLSLGADFGPERVFDPHDAATTGVLYVLPDDAALEPPAHLVTSARPTGWQATVVDALADDIAEHVRRHGDLQLVPGAAVDLAAFGRLPGVCLSELSVDTDCSASVDIDALTAGAPRALLDLYADDVVTAPELTPALERRVARDYSERAFSVWEGPLPTALRPGS